MSAFTAPPAFGDFTRLDDEMVKLVAYTVVSLLRDKEMIVGEDQTIVVDSMTEEQFVAQIIAQFVPTAKFAALPPKLQRAHRKYLRVYYVVSQRWPRQPMKFEERQIKTLEEINNSMTPG